MKQPKKLTRKQKMRLSKKGFNAEQYMLLSEDDTSFTVIAKNPDKNGNKETLTFGK